MKIWERIILGFISVIIIMIFVDTNAIINNIQIINRVEDLEHSKRIELTESNKAAYVIQRIKSNLRELLLELDSGERAEEIILARREIEENALVLSSSLTSIYKATHTGYQSSEDEEDKERELGELAMIDSLNGLTEKFISDIQATLEIIDEGDLEEAKDFFEYNTEPVSRKAQDLIAVIVEDSEEEIAWAINQLHEKVNKTIRFGVYLTILSILLSLAIGLYISRSISAPLYKLIYGAKEIGKGNLETSVSLKTKGELQLLADSFNDMAKELKSRITAINKLNQELEESNQTKDTYFSIIAHDLKNPFNVILGFTDLLVEQYHDFDERERQNIIHQLNKSSKLIYDLLENLLNWSRSQSGKIELVIKNNKLNNIIQKSINSYKGNAKQKDIVIANKTPEETMVYADEFTITVAINNILSNAIKFTPDKGLVSISATGGKDEVMLTIKDSGIGMAQEVIDNLFQSKKIDSTKGTKNEKGTGLGLILVKDFIEKNNGKLKIKSEPGRGTEFQISLPVGKA